MYTSIESLKGGHVDTQICPLGVEVHANPPFQKECHHSVVLNVQFDGVYGKSVYFKWQPV